MEHTTDVLFARLARAETRLASWGGKIDDGRTFQPVAKAEYGRAFDAREKARGEALAADPVRYARAYPMSAFAFRDRLPAPMRAAIEAAETDADMRRAVLIEGEA